MIDIVADHVAHGYRAAQSVEQYPDLTPAQVHAALTYYYDHQDEYACVLFRQDDELLAIARARQALRAFCAGLSYGH